MSEQLQTVDTSAGNPFYGYSAQEGEKANAFLSPNSAVNSYRDYLPKQDRAVNDLWLRKEMITNDDYLDNVVGTMFQQGMDEEMSALYDKNPDQYEKDYKKVKNNVYQELVRETYRGDSINTAIIKREQTLIDFGAVDFNSNVYKGTIQANKKKYQEAGLLDDNGDFMLDPQALNLKLLQDGPLMQEVMDDHLEEFENTLSNSHNTGGIDTDNLDQMAQAYVVYREHGSEGLTQVVNFFSEYEPGKPFEEQSSKAKTAKRFLDEAKKSGKGIDSLMSEFYGSEEAPQGVFTVEPQEESLEMSMDIPKDFNNFTLLTRYNDENEDKALGNFLREFKGDAPEKFSWSGLATSIMGFAGDVASTVSPTFSILPNNIGDYLQRAGASKEDGRRQTLAGAVGALVSPEKRSENDYWDATAEEIVGNITNGIYDHQTRGAVYDIADMAQQGEHFTNEDLLRTVLVNSKPTMAGDKEVYSVNLNESPSHVKLAVEALRHLEGNVVRESGTPGIVHVEPDYQQRLYKQSLQSKIERGGNYQYVPEYDRDGKIVGGKMVAGEQGYIARSAKAVVQRNPLVAGIDAVAGTNWYKPSSFDSGLTDYFTEWVGKTVYEPTHDILKSYVEKNELQDTSFGKGLFQWESSYDETVGEFIDTPEQPDSNLDSIAYGAGQLGGYLFGTLAIGKGALSAAGKFKAFNEFKRYKNSQNTKQILDVLQPTKRTKLGNLSASIGKTTENMTRQQKALHNWLTIEVGEVVRQPITPMEHSVFQIGQVGDEFGFWEDGADLTKAYERSNRIAQIGADMAGNFAISMLFDNVFAMTRFTANKFLGKGGNSWKMKNGEYINLPREKYNLETGYSPDIRRFVSNTMDDMAEMPMGDIKSTLNNYLDGRMIKLAPEQGESIHDMAKLFKDDADIYMDGLWENVRNTLEAYDNQYSGRMSATQSLDSRANEIVESSLNNMADEMTKMFHQGSDSEVGLRFARALKSQEPKDEFVPYTAADGTRKWSMTMEEAQTLNNSTPHSALVENADGTVSVAKLESNLWGVRLANKIEERYVNKNSGAAFEDYVNSKGIDKLDTNPQTAQAKVNAEKEFQEFYMKGVTVNDQPGIVTGLDKDELIVTLRDGKERRVKQADYKGKTTVADRENIAMVQRARRQRLKKTDRDEWFEQYQKTNKKYKDFLKKRELKENTEKIKSLRETDEDFAKYGVPKSYYGTVGKLLDYKRKGKKVFRRLVSSLGHNGYLDYDRFGVNVDNVGRLDAAKMKANGGLKKNVIFTKNTNGVEEHYIVIQKTPEDFPMTKWIRDVDTGELRMNPYIRQIDENKSFEHGIPVRYKPIKKTIDGEEKILYTRARNKDEGVLLNVQRPVKYEGGVTQDDVLEKGIDAVILEGDGGKKFYLLIDETNQVVDPATFKGSSTTNDVTDVTKMRAPSNKTAFSKEDDAKKLISAYQKEGDKHGWDRAKSDKWTPDILIENYIEDMKGNPAKWFGKANASELKEEINRLYSEFLKVRGEIKESPYTSELEKIIPDSPLGKELAKSANVSVLPIIGLAADFMYGDEDDTFKYKYTALGLIGTGVIRANGLLGGSIRKGLKNTWSQKIAPQLRWEKKNKKNIKNLGLGKGDLLSDADEDSIVDKLPDIFGLAKTGAAGVADAVMKNSWTQSQFSFLKKMGISVAEDYRRALSTIERTIGSIKSNPEFRFQSKVYNLELKKLMDNEGLTKEQAEQQLRDLGNSYEDFTTQYGPQKTREVLEEMTGEGFSDAYIERQFGASFARIMHAGFKRADDVDGKITNKSVQDAYGSPVGSRYKAIDKALLGDEQVQMFVNSHREWFSDIKLRWLGVLDDTFQKTVGHLSVTHGDEMSSMAQAFYQSRTTKRSFRAALETAKEKQLFDKLQEVGETWDDIEYLTTRVKKFSEIENYYPQIRSEDATIRAKKNWMGDTTRFGDKSASEIDKAWNDHQISRYIEVNAGDMKSNRLKSQTVDPKTGELHDKVFTGKDAEHKARTEILNNARALRRQGRDEDAERLLAESRVEVQKVTAKGKVKDEYYVVMPDDLAYGKDGLNRSALEKYYKSYLNNIETPQANFLDRPRVANVPHEFMETDINRVRARYSRDVGRRIHNGENEMLTGQQVTDRYIAPIKRELKDRGVNSKQITNIESRLNDIYRVANGLVGEDVENFQRLQKRGFASNIYRNFQFMRFGYGFGNYNFFEWAAVGQHIGGGLGNVTRATAEFTASPQSTVNYENLLRQENIFRREIQFARPEFQNIGIYDYGMDDALSKMDYGLTKGANWLGNFSIMDRLIGRENLQKTGAFRTVPVIGDSFLGSSMFNSAVVSRAALGEASHLTRLAKQLDEMEPVDGVRMIKKNGRTYTKPEIERQLELLGVAPKDQDMFIQGRNKFEKIIDGLNDDPNFTSKIQTLKDDPEMSKYMDLVIDVVRNATESYNGINKIYRPESWDSDIGRTLSMYSTYPFNVSVQITQRRIKQPIDFWFKNYGEQINRQGKVLPAMEIWSKIQMGKTQSLRDMGMTNEAIEAFPSDAIFSGLRVLNSLGISVAGYASLGAMRDVIAWALAPVSGTEHEKWTALERELILNPAAPAEEQISIQNLLDEGLDRDELKALMTYTLGTAGRLGLSGRYLDPISNPWMQYGGLSSIAPVTGDMDTIFTLMGKMAQGNVSYYKEDMGRELANQMLKRIPIYSSNTFSQFRRNINDEYLSKERKAGSSSSGKVVI